MHLGMGPFAGNELLLLHRWFPGNRQISFHREPPCSCWHFRSLHRCQFLPQIGLFCTHAIHHLDSIRRILFLNMVVPSGGETVCFSHEWMTLKKKTCSLSCYSGKIKWAEMQGSSIAAFSNQSMSYVTWLTSQLWEKKSKLENTEVVKRQFKLPKGNFSLFPIKYILIIIFFPSFPPILYPPQPPSNSMPFFSL